MPRKLISAKLPDELAQALEAKMRAQGLTQSQAIVHALSHWLEIPTASSSDQRLSELEARIKTLEQRFTTSTPVNEPARPETPIIEKHVKQVRFTRSTEVNHADGVRWLTTRQAWGIAKTRGCDRTFEAFRSWSKRNPLSCQELYGLRWIDHGSKSNTIASFEDIKQRPPSPHPLTTQN